MSEKRKLEEKEMNTEKKNKKKKIEKGNKKDNEEKKKKYSGYKETKFENEIFEKYYKDSEIIPVEEWDSFYNTLKSGLPIVFRIR
jgi:multisite-specific tRNA:(cytosine-C5)-methyltransferase